jgi:REP element-mobilizing transposase RayT
MARKLRIEYAGAYYHVINRGNYRSWIFETAGARVSFLECLKQVCESQGWRLHAWCLMGNHYHLLVETPEPNLVWGMKWLQSTFANRFNRFRKANGHVFQGRYKALLLDGDAVGPVCHYIHLNPARAGIVEPGALQAYEDSSFHQLWHPRRRWAFVDYGSCLESAGGLADKPDGRALYRDYLRQLCMDESEQRRLGFDEMCSGWAKGSKAFKKAVLADQKDTALRKVVEAEASETREPRWEAGLSKALGLLDRGESDLSDSRKGAEWKVATARWLRERYLAPHRWIAARLNMGGAGSVQTLVSRHRRESENQSSSWEVLNSYEILD